MLTVAYEISDSVCLYILHILAVCVHNTSRTFLPLHRPIILVLSVINITQNCNFGITINRGIKFRRTSKNCDIRPILVYILETIQDRAIVPYFILGSGLISSLQAQAAEWAHMPSQVAKVWHYARTLLGPSHWVLTTPMHVHALDSFHLPRCVLCMSMATFS